MVTPSLAKFMILKSWFHSVHALLEVRMVIYAANHSVKNANNACKRASIIILDLLQITEDEQHIASGHSCISL